MNQFQRSAFLVSISVCFLLALFFPSRERLSLAAQQAVPNAAGTRGPSGTAGPRLGTESGFGLFQQHCVLCHGNPASSVTAPPPEVLRELPPETILEALTTGVMQVQGRELSDEEKRRVAESVSGRLLGTGVSGDASAMPDRCSAHRAFPSVSSGPAWAGWSPTTANTRFQPATAAGLTANQIPNLKLKWAFGYPGGLSASGQPAIAGGRVFIGTDTGYFYSLDLHSGCVYWSFKTKAGLRNSAVVGPIKTPSGAKQAVYFGDLKANVYAVSAQDGTLLWSTHVDDHFTARVTGSPTLYEGRLYVPVSSWEEFSARSLDYPCCTFRGSVVALDANTGMPVWKTYTIPETPEVVGQNSTGTKRWAPAGVSVWNAPTVDPKRHAIYFGTGDSETEPATDTSDGVMALDLKTGSLLWMYQAQKGDSFLAGCTGQNRTENCPKDVGPDADIGNSPMLRTLNNGRRVLIAGTKDGVVFALDPDKQGEKLWSTRVVDASLPKSGIVWGGAADEQMAYFGLSGGGAVAVDMVTGKRVWSAPLSPSGVRVWNAGAATTIPGAVFLVGGDGKIHAISSEDGHVLWEYDAAHDFSTVNQVQARGGSMRTAGVAIASGMVLVGSGYGFGANDITGNVLLAFSAE